MIGLFFDILFIVTAVSMPLGVYKIVEQERGIKKSLKTKDIKKGQAGHVSLTF